MIFQFLYQLYTMSIYRYTTFVTSFLTISDNYETDVSRRMDKFMQIIESGIQICVYGDESTIDLLINNVSPYSNVKIMKLFDVNKSHTALCCKNIDFKLPLYNNPIKDTTNYMILLNSKIEIVYDTIVHNPWNTKYFAWIDSSIPFIFNDMSLCIDNLHRIGNLDSNRIFLAIPGCSQKLPTDMTDILFSQIYWRFCGDFFIGDKDSIIQLYDLQMAKFSTFINHYKVIIWEVNFWSWLESNTDWNPSWYLANHNDSIIQLPSEFFYNSLSSISKSISYPYPTMNSFFPGSASYLKHNGQHFLNTRYINYTIQNKHFIFHDSNNKIITKNVLATLDDNLIPIDFHEMIDPPISFDSLYFQGIEDIRLYSFLNLIHFIGTSTSHSIDGKNLMVKGIYDVINFKLIDSRMIESPYNQSCEKNWTPIISSINGFEKELFIYQWSPFEIYEVVQNKLQIQFSHKVLSPIFSKFRGSSTFCPSGNILIGVVHFSENEFLDPKYFHSLVTLDATSLLPLKFSNPFFFGIEPTIEFCIGFSISDTQYNFWISQHDSNPLLISLPMQSIPISNDA